MLTGERQLSPAAKNIVTEIKGEAIAIRNVVKKMLEISDVVETTYAQNEKMLDLKGAVKAAAPGPSAKGRTQPQNDTAGFEDYIEDRPKGERRGTRTHAGDTRVRHRDSKTTWKTSPARQPT